MLALATFLLTVVLVLWRPGGLHEAVPALLGAVLMFLIGLLDRHDVLRVLAVVLNSAMTIISTFVMAAILEGTGFFRWAADRLLERAAGSGRQLFHLVLAFSACLTLFLNNDGSVLLGTPIFISLVQQLRVSPRVRFGYLLGACLIASAASPPIGISNMANLEAMSLVAISLTDHLRAVVLPALLGLATCWILLYAIFNWERPEQYALVQPPPPPPPPPPPRPGLRPQRHPVPPHAPIHPAHHPARPGSPVPRTPAGPPSEPDFPFMWFALAVVVVVRLGFFAASLAGIRTYVVAMAGAAILLVANMYRRVLNPGAVVRQAPWHVLAFALGMDLVVFGMRNAGATGLLAARLGPLIRSGVLGASFAPGVLTAAISALLNNHPGLIIGALTLTDIADLGRTFLHLAYASVVLGTDLGALLTPVGTLASLLWFHILHRQGLRYTWWDYGRVTLVVIPVSFLVALSGLYGMAILAGH